MLDAVEYKNDAKRAWRRQVWEVLGHLRRKTYRPVSGPVLYLAGSRDLDSHLAIRHGWSSQDLIAVENDDSVARVLRSKGRNTITAGLSEVLIAWPEHTAVSLVIADLCSNFCSSAINIMYQWLTRLSFRYGYLVINIQRGREGKGVMEIVQEWKEGLPWRTATGLESKHRALMVCGEAMRLISQSEEAYHHILQCLSYVPLPSYKSGRVLMDSAVFWWKRTHEDIALSIEPVDENVKRKIAAALAIRTRRMAV